MSIKLLPSPKLRLLHEQAPASASCQKGVKGLVVVQPGFLVAAGGTLLHHAVDSEALGRTRKWPPALLELEVVDVLVNSLQRSRAAESRTTSIRRLCMLSHTAGCRPYACWQ
jgi:hypothetical protein